MGRWFTIFCMFVLPPDLTAEAVLGAFQHDAIALFLGAAFISVGLVSIAFAIVRRKADPLLIYLALFASLYGARMWMQSGLVALSWSGSDLYLRLRSLMDFLMPIPAFLFFSAAGLIDRWGKIAAWSLAATGVGLAVAAMAGESLQRLHVVNNVSVVIVLSFLGAQLFLDRRTDIDFRRVRVGLAVFVAFALWTNVDGALNLRLPDLEPIGFAVFLGSLAYVAARRTLQRDLQLNEIQKELEVARKIQMSILPGDFPPSSSFRVQARYVPMTSVAGDFYEYVVADDTRAGLLIADVSGHGVPAALIASMVKLAATSQRDRAADPAALLKGMNGALRGNTQSQFVTAAYLYLDAVAGCLNYSAAGHPPMLLLREGKVIEIQENGLMLAAFDFAAYSNATHPLQARDRLLLYTDGLVEAANMKGDFFGQEALASLLQETAEFSPSEVADRMISAVQGWAAAQDDDWTVIVCDYRAPMAGGAKS